MQISCRRFFSPANKWLCCFYINIHNGYTNIQHGQVCYDVGGIGIWWKELQAGKCAGDRATAEEKAGTGSPKTGRLLSRDSVFSVPLARSFSRCFLAVDPIAAGVHFLFSSVFFCWADSFSFAFFLSSRFSLSLLVGGKCVCVDVGMFDGDFNFQSN